MYIIYICVCDIYMYICDDKRMYDTYPSVYKGYGMSMCSIHSPMIFNNFTRCITDRHQFGVALKNQYWDLGISNKLRSVALGTSQLLKNPSVNNHVIHLRNAQRRQNDSL